MAALECSCGLTRGLSAQSETEFRRRADGWLRNHAEAEERRRPVFAPKATAAPTETVDPASKNRSGRVAAAGEPSTRRTAEHRRPTAEHHALQPVKKSDGTWHSTRIACSCGKQRAGWGYSREESVSLSQAQVGFEGHLRKAGLPEKERRVERAIEGGIGVVLLAVAAVVVFIVVGLGANVVTWFGDDSSTDTTSEFDDSGSGVDCDKAVSKLMESMYGSWGSGSWPEGEYPERVAQCKGE